MEGRRKKFSLFRVKPSRPPLSKSPVPCQIAATAVGRWQFSCSEGLCQNISVGAENLLLRIIRATTICDLCPHPGAWVPTAEKYYTERANDFTASPAIVCLMTRLATRNIRLLQFNLCENFSEIICGNGKVGAGDIGLPMNCRARRSLAPLSADSLCSLPPSLLPPSVIVVARESLISLRRRRRRRRRRPSPPPPMRPLPCPSCP